MLLRIAATSASSRSVQIEAQNSTDRSFVLAYCTGIT
jgi:hypothetical protein